MALTEYQIVKDSDATVRETITGRDITGATITWMVVPYAQSFDGDLDAITPSISKTVGSGVTIVTPASGIFDVAIDPADTEDLAEGYYWVLMRVTLASGVILSIEKYLIEITA